MVIASPIKRATYYPEFHRLTYWVSDHAQMKLFNLTETQARQALKEVATGPKEVVQVLDIVPNSKI